MSNLKKGTTLTPEQKAQRKAKREANPQFSHLSSAARKAELSAFKKDAKRNLIEAKRRAALFTVDSVNQYENAAKLKQCKVCINKIAKDNDLLALAIDSVRVDKKTGNFSPYYFAQLVQRVIFLQNKKGSAHTFETALQCIAAEKRKTVNK